MYFLVMGGYFATLQEGLRFVCVKIGNPLPQHMFLTCHPKDVLIIFWFNNYLKTVWFPAKWGFFIFGWVQVGSAAKRPDDSMALVFPP